MFLLSCMCEKGEVQDVQLQSTPRQRPSFPPHPSLAAAFFLACAQTAVDDAAVGTGAYLSRSPAPSLSLSLSLSHSLSLYK